MLASTVVNVHKGFTPLMVSSYSYTRFSNRGYRAVIMEDISTVLVAIDLLPFARLRYSISIVIGTVATQYVSGSIDASGPINGNVKGRSKCISTLLNSILSREVMGDSFTTLIA